MKIKPVVSSRIKSNHTSFEIDLVLDINITFIIGNSGTGKSAVFSIIKEMAAEDNTIKCFNYLDKSTGYKNAIKLAKGKLFVIDNADILLDDSLRSYISTDGKNQYVIIGRNPTGLLLDQTEIYELNSEKSDGKTFFTLKKSFE